jgi:flagellar basal-body rod protein FlgF
MDRLIYVAMSGAKAVTERMGATTHNLANASTTGYRAQLAAFRAAALPGDAWARRVFATDNTVGSDFAEGAIQRTGRDLDIAIQGPGWISVQALDGEEAYSRAGSLRISPEGLLETNTGLPVLGDGGPIAIPPDSRVAIGRDGTISATANQAPFNVTNAGRIKLVNPPETELKRSADGLFRLKEGGAAPADENVGVVSGALESSNVNGAEALVSMITLARQFELQMRMLQTADQNARAATQLLTINP